MPTIQHSALTTGELHEPKGVASATSEDVYVADGAGSGTWYKLQTKAWENIDHGGSSQALSSGVRTKVLNDAAGASTFTSYQFPDATGSIWDSTNNQFDWEAADLKVGDTVDIRFDVEYTVDTNNDGFLLELDLGVGSATNVSLPIDQRNIDQAGTQQVVRFISIFIGNNDILTSPAELYVTADSGSDSILINGWYCRMNPLNPRFA